METTAAASASSAAVSLFSVCKDLISAIIKGTQQVNQNNTKAINCSIKAKCLVKLIDTYETKYNECSTWLDHISREELKSKLEYIKSLLKNAESEIPTNQKKRKWFKADSVREFIATLEVTLKEVDNELAKLKETITQILDRPRRPSSAFSEIDYPLPSVVTDVAAKSEGNYIVVSWKDPNSTDNIQHYNIYVDELVQDIYDPSTSPNNNSNEYSVRLSTRFDAWGMYLIQVSAVNKAKQEGQRSSHVSVVMNKCPPDIKPAGLKVLTASSRTSVILGVDRPENFDKMEISKCKICGVADKRSPLSMEGILLEIERDTNTLHFEVKDIESTWNCEVAVIFCNDHGDGIRSDEIIQFQIDSMKPSKPNLSLIQKSSEAVKIEILTEINPGNILQYHLYRQQGSQNGELKQEPQPIKQQGAAPITYDINDLQPRKKYYFHVVSESAVDGSTYKSDILMVKTPAT